MSFPKFLEKVNVYCKKWILTYSFFESFYITALYIQAFVKRLKTDKKHLKLQQTWHISVSSVWAWFQNCPSDFQQPTTTRQRHKTRDGRLALIGPNLVCWRIFNQSANAYQTRVVCKPAALRCRHFYLVWWIFKMSSFKAGRIFVPSALPQQPWEIVLAFDGPLIFL